MSTETKEVKAEPKFSKGPWAAFKGLLDDEGIWVMSTHVEDAVVASIGMDMPEAEANAYLIAAAPSLVEAMISAVLPYEALLIDAESRKWIAPEVWGAIESAVAKVRAALALVDGPQES